MSGLVIPSDWEPPDEPVEYSASYEVSWDKAPSGVPWAARRRRWWNPLAWILWPWRRRWLRKFRPLTIDEFKAALLREKTIMTDEVYDRLGLKKPELPE